MKLFDDLERFRNKPRLENQVLRRITGNREFGRQDQVRAGGGEAFVGVDDFVEISLQIANRRIELCKTDFHAQFASGSTMRAGVRRAIRFVAAGYGEDITE